MAKGSQTDFESHVLKLDVLISKRNCLLCIIVIALASTFLIYRYAEVARKGILKFKSYGIARGLNHINSNLHLKIENHFLKKPFKILFWTKWFGNGSGFIRTECSQDFIVTSNKSDYEDADAIVFQYVDLKSENVQLPNTRNKDVPWILAMFEASIHYPMFLLNGQSIMDGLFNWTWSFRGDSFIHPNFTESFAKYEKIDTRWVYGSTFSKEFLSKKQTLAAWVASNCLYQRSKRNTLVRNLKLLGIQIHTYGKCGRPFCEKGGSCFSSLGESYKFYLAFENALCEGYVTEKIYNGLLHGMVPVVYALGDVDIKMNAPPNSYINALDFPTIEALADYLKYLDGNPEQYFKYFEWRQFYNLTTDTYINQCHDYVKMKEYVSKLNTDEDFKYRHVYENLSVWFHTFKNPLLNRKCDNCIQPEMISTTELYKIKSIMYNDSSRCQ